MFGVVPFFSRNRDMMMPEEDGLDRLMDAFQEPFFSGFHSPDFKVDVKDNGGSYDLTAELPGMKKDDISLTYKDHYLTIAAKNEKSDDQKDDKGNYVRRERSQSSMSRSFYIDGINGSKISADYKDGILKVTMPKLDEKAEQGHKIAIKG